MTPIVYQMVSFEDQYEANVLNNIFLIYTGKCTDKKCTLQMNFFLLEINLQIPNSCNILILILIVTVAIRAVKFTSVHIQFPSQQKLIVPNHIGIRDFSNNIVTNNGW